VSGASHWGQRDGPIGAGRGHHQAAMVRANETVKNMLGTDVSIS